MAKAKDLRDQSVVELEELLKETRKKQFENVNKLHMEKKSDKPHLARTYRKDAARILTVLREKELESSTTAGRK